MVRATDPGIGEGVGADFRGQRAKSKAIGADCRVASVGSALVGAISSDVDSSVLGRRYLAKDWRRASTRGNIRDRLYRYKGHGRSTASVALSSLRQAGCRLWNLEDAVGRYQSLSTSDRAHSAPLE